MARPDFTKIWASSRATIPAIGPTDYASGLLAYLGDQPPSTDDHDFIFNLQDERAAWLKDQALLSVGHEWQTDVTYDVNAYVRPVGGGALYKSLTAGNLGNEPTASPANWEQVEIGEVADASTTVKGVVELADNTETQTGTDAVRVVTPAGLASVTATETRRGLVEIATGAEAAAGVDASRGVTPAGLRAGLNAAGAAPVYACRAWVNFNGLTNVIRASGNVSSITDLGTGQYTINFTAAMSDSNYAVIGSGADSSTFQGAAGRIIQTYGYAAGAATIAFTDDSTNTAQDVEFGNVAIWR